VMALLRMWSMPNSRKSMRARAKLVAVRPE
jgi:hypothetical protein